MAYQTLLAHLSNESVASTVLKVAALFAEQHLAHLVGIHLQPPVELYVTEVPLPVEVVRQYTDQQKALESRIKEQFDQTTHSQNYVSEWRVLSGFFGSVSDALVEQGNASDLILISQHEGETADSRFKKLPELVLMASGRPVMVIPVGKELQSVGDRVMIAWDGRRESTRALFSALPLLRRASEVRLHRINLPHQDRIHSGGITEELANTLSRHGVNLELLHSDARKSEIADELLLYSQDMGADVLVMGCYGHSPLREFILGGTTRAILAESPVPVLMSN